MLEMEGWKQFVVALLFRVAVAPMVDAGSAGLSNLLISNCFGGSNLLPMLGAPEMADEDGW